MTAVWVGIDVGTTGLKAVVTGLDGRRISEGSRRYRRTVEPAGAIEQNADDWWDAATDVLPAVIGDHEVRAVAVTSQAPTLVPVDVAGRPTGPALLWADRRAQREALEIGAGLRGPATTAPDSFFGTAKLLWLSRYRGRQLAGSAAVLSANGFLTHRLTGEFTLDDSTASMMQGWRGGRGDFEGGLAELGVPVHLLPDAVPCLEVVGAVTHFAADATGLPEGCPVAAGAIDAVGTALETGTLTPGDPFAEMTGFSTVGMLATDSHIRITGFIHARHCLPGVGLVITAQVTAGATVDWILGNSAAGAALLQPGRLAECRRPNPVRMVPTLAGERTPGWNAHARGSVSGIGLDTTTADLVVAAMEGTALALAEDLSALRSAGLVIDRVRSTGGGANSDMWLQIKADVLGLPVERPAGGSGAAQGAAYLAGLAVGDLTGADGVRECSARTLETFRPDPVLTRAYGARLAGFRAQREFFADQDRPPD